MPLLLIDEDLPRTTASLLKQLNIESMDVHDRGLRGKSDEEVFDYAVKHKATILTADRGFGNIHRFPLGSHSGIIVLHASYELAPSEYDAFVLKNLSKLNLSEVVGCVVIVEDDKIRIRK